MKYEVRIKSEELRVFRNAYSFLTLQDYIVFFAHRSQDFTTKGGKVLQERQKDFSIEVIMI
jgi:hypothetical protein